MLCLLTLCLTICLILYSTWTYDYWKKRRVPYARPVPFFGNIMDIITFRKPIADVIREIYTLGDGHPFLGYYQLRSPAFLVRDPALAKRVLVTDFDSFSDPVIFADSTLDPMMARNPFMLTGDVWKAVRTLLTPGFTPSKVKALYPTINLVNKDLLDHLQALTYKKCPDGVDVRDLMGRYTTDVVVRCGFGVCGNSFSDTENTLRRLGEVLMPTGLFNAARLVIFFLIPSVPKILRPRFMTTDSQNFFRMVIRELMSYRTNNRVFRNDFLHMLMQIKHRRRSAKGENTIHVAGIDIEYTDEDIASHALMLFFVGSEIPTTVLSYVLFELAWNQDIQTRLRAELDTVLSQHSGGLTFEAVQEMTYLEMVLNETLRLHPPFPFLTRLCTKDFELQLPDESTSVLEKGTVVVIPNEAIHLDSQYFSEPHKFDPERFSIERKRDIKPFTYLPFGEGPRQCIGMKFAMSMMKLGLATMLSQFEIRTTSKTPKCLTYDPFSPMLDFKETIWLDFVQRK